MAGTRTVRRDSRGRYAGSSGGGRLSTEKAGGFANTAFRSRASAPKGLAPRSTVAPTRSSLKGRGSAKNLTFKSRAARAGKLGVRIGVGGAVGAVLGGAVASNTMKHGSLNTFAKVVVGTVAADKAIRHMGAAKRRQAAASKRVKR